MFVCFVHFVLCMLITGVPLNPSSDVPHLMVHVSIHFSAILGHCPLSL